LKTLVLQEKTIHIFRPLGTNQYPDDFGGVILENGRMYSRLDKLSWVSGSTGTCGRSKDVGNVRTAKIQSNERLSEEMRRAGVAACFSF